MNISRLRIEVSRKHTKASAQGSAGGPRYRRQVYQQVKNTSSIGPIVAPWPLKVAIWMPFWHKEVSTGLTWAWDRKAGVSCVLVEPGEGVCLGTVSIIATLHQLGCAPYWRSSTQPLDRDDPSVQETLETFSGWTDIYVINMSRLFFKKTFNIDYLNLMSPTDEDSMLG